MERGRQCYERAIRLDPQYALPHAGLAEYYYLLGLFSHSLPRDVLPLATASAERAIELDPSFSDAYSARGAFRVVDYKWKEAAADFAKAIELNPADALSHFRYAVFYLHRWGRPDEVIAELKLALDLDPLHLHFRAWEVLVLHAYGRPEAVERARAMVESFPGFWYGCFLCGFVLIERGFAEEGAAAMQNGQVADPAYVYLLAGLALAASRQGRLDEAKGLRAQLDERSAKQYVSPFARALACAACGEFDRTYEWLDRGLDERDPFSLFCFDLLPVPGLKSDPRFHAMLREMKLETP
jgi:serine/threonine-protein kinase